MNIVREQREQNNSLIKVTVGEKDYGDAVEKSLREYKRKANIPGFRPGMVPMGVIKKMYGKGVLAEQAYRQASEAAFNYLQEQKIDYVGDVIPSEEQGDFDFENGTEFEFIFEIGEAPEVKLELSAKDKMTYYTIKVDKKMHDDYRSNFLRRFGRLVDTDKVTADEALEVTLDNGGKLLLLQRVLVSLAPSLRVYRRPSQRAAFLESLLALIEELQAYAVAPEVLAEKAEAIAGESGERLRDVALLYGAYLAKLHEGGRDARDRLEKLEENLAASGYADNKDIFLDGFSFHFS